MPRPEHMRRCRAPLNTFYQGIVTKISVISGTHLGKPTSELSQLQHSVFADVSMSSHAGDLTELEVLEAFLSGRPFLRKTSVGILTLEESISGQIINL